MSHRYAQSLKVLFSQEPLVPTRRVWPAGVRLAVLAVLLLAVMALAAGVRAVAGSNPALSLLAGAVVVAGSLIAYAAAVRAMEQRAVVELDPATATSALRTGSLAGVGLFTATLVLIAVFGGYGTDGGGSVGGMLAVLGLMTGVAVTEELLFRGVVFRLLEELTGTRAAVAVSAPLFGVIHLLNPGATVWGALAIAVEAGLMLGAAYAATRNLWLPIGLHLGWNFAGRGIYGAGISGDDTTPVGLVQGVFSGPEAITGGDFGPEASIFAVLVCAVPTILFLRAAKRRGRLYTRGQLRAGTETSTASSTASSADSSTDS
ncbi:CPBP family intramembrane glutamic endopeptidase [Streptomyces sp. NPDC048484]|uniref:CPBP family intramembrane glutamic endopeptidase n=1 Tax=Streptomyces sp. NPDC048484 TaxID=3155146 RepID=UPI0034452D1D